jgi:hypothetical protein
VAASRTHVPYVSPCACPYGSSHWKPLLGIRVCSLLRLPFLLVLHARRLILTTENLLGINTQGGVGPAPPSAQTMNKCCYLVDNEKVKETENKCNLIMVIKEVIKNTLISDHHSHAHSASITCPVRTITVLESSDMSCQNVVETSDVSRQDHRSW